MRLWVLMFKILVVQGKKRGGGGQEEGSDEWRRREAREVFRGQVSQILNIILRFRFRGSRTVTQCFAPPLAPLFLPRSRDSSEAVSAEECLGR